MTQEAQTALQRYKCHKEVRAAKMVALQHIDLFSRTRRCDLDNGGYVLLSDEYCARHQPQVGGYYVLYDDGYESFSPAKAFENGYTPINDAA